MIESSCSVALAVSVSLVALLLALSSSSLAAGGGPGGGPRIGPAPPTPDRPSIVLSALTLSLEDGAPGPWAKKPCNCAACSCVKVPADS